MQARRKFLKQVSQIAMLGNGLGYFQKRLMLRFRRSFRQQGDGSVSHRLQNNIAVRRRSTVAIAYWLLQSLKRRTNSFHGIESGQSRKLFEKKLSKKIQEMI
jgi:hypothetical protein